MNFLFGYSANKRHFICSRGRSTVWLIVISQETNMLDTVTVQPRGGKQPVLQSGNRVLALVQIPALPFTIWVSWGKLFNLSGLQFS